VVCHCTNITYIWRRNSGRSDAIRLRKNHSDSTRRFESNI